MKRILHSLLILPLLATALSLTAQDARFSQYYNNPVVLNPALTGNGIEYIRVAAIYRTQWAGMGVPFTTQGFAVDKAVNKVGLGAAITRNGAGDGAIRTLSIAGNLSYNLPVGSSKMNTFSAGMQVGIINKSFDESKLTFDNQYNPDLGYDPNINSNEIFSTTSITRPDVNIGLMWQRGWMKKDIRFKPFAGLAMFHITRPSESFIDDLNNKAPIKNSFYAGFGYMLNDNLELKPTVMHLKQGVFGETTFGSIVSYSLDNKNNIQAGVYNRLNDAIIAYAGYQMNRLFVGMSYDINNSELSKSGKGTNAFEISLTWSPFQKVKKAPTAKKEEVLAKKKTEGHAITETIPMIEVPKSTVPDMIIAIRPVVGTEIIPVMVTKNNAENTKETSSVKTAETPKIKTETVVNEIIKTQPVEAVTTPQVKDSDGDGIPDHEDECPYIKGGIATRGCPDSDGDGIIDMLDDCPFESGPATNNGCPDPNQPITKNHQELVKQFDNILFATGLTKITTEDLFDIIERAIDIMYADKTTTAIISGHTDFEGDENMNMVLSQARAEIVKAYLVKQGIDESRIQTISYGETMPVGNNLTGEGRKLNRRVEINLIRK